MSFKSLSKGKSKRAQKKGQKKTILSASTKWFLKEI